MTMASGSSREGTDVASLTTDDASLHLVVVDVEYRHGILHSRFRSHTLYGLDDDALGLFGSRHACIVHNLVDVSSSIRLCFVLQRLDQALASLFDTQAGNLFELRTLLIDEVGEACIDFLFLLLEECLLRLHALTLSVGFLFAACQFVLLLVELHLALLDAVLRLLYLLIVLPHLLLEFCAFGQEFLLHLKQFLLLDDFCLLLCVLASLTDEGFLLCWQDGKIPYCYQNKECHDSD